MQFQDIKTWLNQEFHYPVPEDYLSFLEQGDFTTTLRSYYIMDIENESVLEISEWFTYDNLSEIYHNCVKENLIEKYYLPVFDSCGCTVVINCNPQSDTYGQVFMRTPAGYYDETLQTNVYMELDFVAKTFDDLIHNLKSAEELEEMGIF